MKTTSKVLVGAGALDHYAFAKNKLAIMNMMTSLPVMTKTLKIGNAIIIIKKGRESDKILIIARPPQWLAFGLADYYGPVYSQLAEAKKPVGPWKEPPVSDGVDSKNAFPAPPITNARLADPNNIMVMGDGRYAFQFNSNDSTGTIVTGFFSYDSKRKFKGLLQLTGKTPNDSILPSEQRYETFPVQQYWAPDERVGNDNAFQLATLTMNQRVGVGSPDHPGEEIGVVHRSVRFMAMDTDYGSLGSDRQPTGTRTVFPIVDVETGGWVTGEIHNPGLHLVYFCFLTPKTILVGNLGGVYSTVAAATFDQKIGASVDGGKTWTLTTFNADPNLGDLRSEYAIRRWCAIDSKTALWLGGDYGFTTKQVDDGYGNFSTRPDDTGYAIFKVTVDGTRTLLFRPDRDIPWPYMLPSFRAIDWIDIYNIGRNALVLVAVVRSSEVNDQRDLVNPPYNGLRSQNTRSRTYCSRSFDGGASWDAPTYSGFYYAGNGTIYDVDQTTLTELGYSRVISSTFYPGSYMNRLYCHEPYNSTEDQGAVYVTAINANYAGQPGNLLQTEAPNQTLLYKSVDACRTFTRVCPIGTKKFYKGSDNTGSLLYAPVYPGIVDSGAPIDPIFPWRVDSRRTPPDWWIGES